MSIIGSFATPTRSAREKALTCPDKRTDDATNTDRVGGVCDLQGTILQQGAAEALAVL